MITKKNFSLKKYNSFNIDVNAKEFIEINCKEELIGLNGLLKDEKILFLGGGSNVLFTKDYDGTVIYLNIKGINIEKENSDFSVVKANAGENWSDFIKFCLKYLRKRILPVFLQLWTVKHILYKMSGPLKYSSLWGAK